MIGQAGCVPLRPRQHCPLERHVPDQDYDDGVPDQDHGDHDCEPDDDGDVDTV